MTPIKVSDAPEKKIHLNDSCVYILVELKGDKTQYAALQIPETLDRFIKLPTLRKSKEKHILVIDDVI